MSCRVPCSDARLQKRSTVKANAHARLSFARLARFKVAVSDELELYIHPTASCTVLPSYSEFRSRSDESTYARQFYLSFDISRDRLQVAAEAGRSERWLLGRCVYARSPQIS